MVFRPLFWLFLRQLACLLGSITRMMFRLYSEGLAIVDLVGLLRSRAGSRHYRHLMLYLNIAIRSVCNRLPRAHSDPKEPITARFTTNVSLNAGKQLRQVVTFLARYRSGGTPATRCIPGMCQFARAVVQRSRGSSAVPGASRLLVLSEPLLLGGF